MSHYRALLVQKQDDSVRAGVQELPDDRLPEGDVTVRVSWSDLNYKDGLAILGKAKVVRTYPMVPGIDLAGEVVASEVAEFAPGDRVLATGWGMGERHWGGFAQLTRLPAEWLVPLPAGLSPGQAMALGTAGLTAMLALMSLEERGLTPDGGEIAVTGASGGVGSLSVALLSARGYNVTASTGRIGLRGYLEKLGARTVEGRDLFAKPSRPLQSERFAGAIDAVGGETLSALLTMMGHQAGVASAGNAGGNQLDTTVLPFILRGVALLGVDSATAPRARRITAWHRLASEFPLSLLSEIVTTATLQALPGLANEILSGKIKGRVVVDVNEVE
ncbi:MAG: oxidoreductase [Chloroflexota bacterium]